MDENNTPVVEEEAVEATPAPEETTAPETTEEETAA
jgi:hypothetical protein